MEHEKIIWEQERDEYRKKNLLSGITNPKLEDYVVFKEEDINGTLTGSQFKRRIKAIYPEHGYVSLERMGELIEANNVQQEKTKKIDDRPRQAQQSLFPDQEL